MRQAVALAAPAPDGDQQAPPAQAAEQAGDRGAGRSHGRRQLGVSDAHLDLCSLTRRPAELLGLSGGTLRPGSPADVVVFDPDAPWVLDRADLKSKCKNTPFDEARLSGRVTRTIVAGRTVYEYV